MAQERIFLGWDRPLVEVACERLLELATGVVPDLGGVLVLVSTASAGRRLRHGLATRAGVRGRGVLMGPVLTPEQLLAPGQSNETPAGSVWELAAWIRALMDADPGDYPLLVPGKLDFTTAHGLALRIRNLEQLLGERGLDPRQVLESGLVEEDSELWTELSGLHQTFRSLLSDCELADRNRIRIQVAREPSLPPGINRVVVLGVPDPLPLVVDCLESLGEVVPVEVWVFAPPELDHLFDDWGRPLAEKWRGRTLPVSREMIVPCITPGDQARAALSLLGPVDSSCGDLVVGCPDPEVGPHLKSELAALGLGAFEPGGSRLAEWGLGRLLETLLRFGREATVEVLAELCRLPAVLAYLVPDQPGEQLLAALDRARCEHLPQDVSELEQLALGRLSPGDRELVRSAARGAGQLWRMLCEPGGVRELLTALFPPESPRWADPGFLTCIEALAEGLSQTGHDRDLTTELGFSPGEHTRLLVENLLGLKVPPVDDGRNQVSLPGWLELLWNDSPELVVTGMNDGRVPETVLGDPFLPDRVRRGLGLRSNESRLARDCYLTEALVASRGQGGRVDFLLGRFTSEGDPLRPSRVLMRCPDSELPERVQFLFTAGRELGASPRKASGWQLRPPAEQWLPTIAVTGFRDYLACPFRFYLKRVLRMESVDDRAREMDPAQTGTLIHEALEAMGQEPGLRDVIEPQRIQDFLIQKITADFKSLFGSSPSAPLMVQLEGMIQKLSAAARVQAREREAGWRIEQVEFWPDEEPLVIGGVKIRGRVDRMDVHQETGEVRLLDYKTYNRPEKPGDVHLGTARPWTRDYALVPGARGNRAWKDLQLPLYAMAARILGLPRVQVGFFHLPAAVTETGIILWEELDGDLLSLARTCAEGVVADLNAGIFWPPAGKVEWDDFEGILGAEPERRVEPSALVALAEPGEVE